MDTRIFQCTKAFVAANENTTCQLLDVSLCRKVGIFDNALLSGDFGRDSANLPLNAADKKQFDPVSKDGVFAHTLFYNYCTLYYNNNYE